MTSETSGGYQRTPEQLACQAQAGCLRSFDELARRMQPRLAHFLQWFVPSPQDAEDVTQEALFQAYKSLKTYDPQYQFSTWLFTIARRIASRRRFVSPQSAPSTAPNEPARIELHEATQREYRESLWQKVRQATNSDEFTALWMFYVEDALTAEIAQSLGKSLASTKMMLSRVRARLEEELRPWVSDSPDARVDAVTRQLRSAQCRRAA